MTDGATSVASGMTEAIARCKSIDRDTVAALREHHRRPAEERLAARSAWSDSGGLVFVGKWGESLYPDTVTALMTKMINSHNKAVAEPGHRLPHARLMIFLTCTPPLCCSQASRFTWSPRDVFAQAIKVSVSNTRNDS